MISVLFGLPLSKPERHFDTSHLNAEAFYSKPGSDTKYAGGKRCSARQVMLQIRWTHVAYEDLCHAEYPVGERKPTEQTVCINLKLETQKPSLMTNASSNFTVRTRESIRCPPNQVCYLAQKLPTIEPILDEKFTEEEI